MLNQVAGSEIKCKTELCFSVACCAGEFYIKNLLKKRQEEVPVD